MNTTVQISKELKDRLESMKIHPRETYEEVIEDLIESVSELSEETKKAIRASEEDVRHGNVHTLDAVKKELGI